MLKTLLYYIGFLFFLIVFLSTSCEHGIYFESKLSYNSTFAIYGLRRVDNKVDFLGIASTEQLYDSSIYGNLKFDGGRKISKVYMRKYDSVQIVLLPDSLYWKFPFISTKTIDRSNAKEFQKK